MKKLTSLASLVTLVIVSPTIPAAAVDPFYKGKTISIMVGYGPGGVYDQYGRLVAQYLGRHISGNPSVIARNVVGAGSVTLANTLYNVGPNDGTAIGLVGFALPVEQVLGSTGYRFQASKFNWIGRISASAGAIVSWHTLPVKTIEDVKKTEVFIASPGQSTSSSLYPTLLNSFIGTKFKIIYGYGGTQETLLAMERGEVGGVQMATMDPKFSILLRDKKINVLAQVTVERDPMLRDVPTVVELVNNDDDKKVMKLFSVINDIGRSFFLPPEVPQDRVAVLRDSFMTMVADAELLAFANRANLSVDPMDGHRVQKLIVDIGKTPRAILDRANAAKKTMAVQ